ncbi:PilZ domain-containing protein [Novosphingobium flavum]|uniref:PilZ domain-containing protein n=1 Tax=Novosphingobium flavum TaxID=1778672 RepID=A0A7X1FUZ9_9SPHN|nr:PilZ domain-containing protein [Novosphingobium flavum]MBC2667489.1 PilZ domain-containing protein [Novosphingobium flavum]
MGNSARDEVCGWQDEEEAGTERRAAPRLTMMIRPAKLIADDREFLCVVRDLSKGGLKLRLFAPLPRHRRLIIEFDNGERHLIEQVWHEGDMAGFRFAGEVDLVRLIAVQQADHPRRQPRLNIAMEATVCTGGLRTPVILRDISQRGASIECNGWLMIDELVRLECAVLPTLHAKVRWRRPPHYGLVFEQTFQLPDLARICAELSAPEA